MEVVFDAVGDGFDRSVTVVGDERGPALGFGPVVTVRRVASGVSVTVRPGVVTSEVVVVVVVVLSLE